MAWDVTVPDTYAESHIGDTATEEGAAANQAAANKIAKYDELASRQQAHLLPSCHRNRRYLESLGCWACPGNWQTGHINHWWTQRIHLSVSAVVNSPPKVRSPSYTLLTLIRCRCSHNLLSTILSLRLCASGQKNNTTTIFIVQSWHRDVLWVHIMFVLCIILFLSTYYHNSTLHWLSRKRPNISVSYISNYWVHIWVSLLEVQPGAWVIETNFAFFMEQYFIGRLCDADEGYAGGEDVVSASWATRTHRQHKCPARCTDGRHSSEPQQLSVHFDPWQPEPASWPADQLAQHVWRHCRTSCYFVCLLYLSTNMGRVWELILDNQSA